MNATIGPAGLVQRCFLQNLPPVGARDVLDVGCGTGELARWCSAEGASSVLGIDPSVRRIQLARSQTEDPRIRFVQEPIENLSLYPESMDVVLSSMVLQYVADYHSLVHRIHTWLRPGGVLAYAREHPMRVASYADGDGCMENYASEGPRERAWLGARERTYHHKVSTLLSALLEAGFVLERVLEPQPAPDVLARDKGLREYYRCPEAFYVRAVKPSDVSSPASAQVPEPA